VSVEPRYVADEKDDWPPREPQEAETPSRSQREGVSQRRGSVSAESAADPQASAENGRPRSTERKSSTGPESIAQFMEKWAAKLSPEERRQWLEHGRFSAGRWLAKTAGRPASVLAVGDHAVVAHLRLRDAHLPLHLLAHGAPLPLGLVLQ
jgi:hypothetical protein